MSAAEDVKICLWRRESCGVDVYKTVISGFMV